MPTVFVLETILNEWRPVPLAASPQLLLWCIHKARRAEGQHAAPNSIARVSASRHATLLLGKDLFRIWCWVRERVHHLRSSLEDGAFRRIGSLAPAKDCDRFVYEYSGQPTPKGTFVLKTLHLAEGHQGTILNGVFGFFVVAQNALRQAIKDWPIA
jgi:hypothetical protein